MDNNPFDRLLTLMTRPWVTLVVVALIVLSFSCLDQPLAIYLHGVDLKTNSLVLNWITKLGISVIYLPAFFLLAIFFRFIQVNRTWEARAWFLFACVAVPVVICGVLKVLLGRARPVMFFKEHLYGFYGLQWHSPFWSFPSGHTTTIMGVVLGLAILFPRYCYALLTTGFIVALSRVLLTQHYLSDVLTASYLTLLEIGLLLWVLRRKSWLAPAWMCKDKTLYASGGC